MTSFAVDVGGTFTDLVLLDHEGGVLVAKAPTTPSDPTQGILSAIEQASLDLSESELFFHGTTLGINTLLEGKGAKVGLITTEGFRDVLQIGRMSWPMYRLHWDQPPPLVPRYLRRGVPERLLADGSVEEPLNEQATLAAVQELVGEDVDSIAVCLLHAYAHPQHERRIGELIETAHPGLDYTLSHLVTTEYREFERSVTTVVDASISRRMVRYIATLEDELAAAKFSGDLYVTRADGGVMTTEQVRRQSVRTLLSGPASGVMGAVALARALDIPNVIAADMGGTSFDAALVVDGQPRVTSNARVEELTLLMPVLQLATVGAGGGSIAWIDAGGALEVGPQSAGADPGPACYGKGGTEPTFTDAAVASGLVDPQEFLGGAMPLDKDAARGAIESRIADPLGLDVDTAASGIVELIEAKMAATLEEITIKEGFDPRTFALLAYGGGGPLVATALARRLQIPTVIVPRSPATFSAWGMLNLDLVHDFARTAVNDVTGLDPSEVSALFGELEREAHAALERDGVDADRRQLLAALDMRYDGQEHTLTVELGTADVGALDLAELRATFDRRHEATYGYAMEDPVQVTAYRIRATGTLAKPAWHRLEAAAQGAGPAPKGTRRATHGASGGEHEWAIYERDALEVGSELVGPAIVEEASSTTLLSPGDTLAVDDYGNLIVTVSARAGAAQRSLSTATGAS